MNRNVKQLQLKSRTHQVSPPGRNNPITYFVGSGNPESDAVYTVRLQGIEAPTCTCDWRKWHPGSLCSHGLAVLNANAEEDGRYVSLWSTEDDAKRQRVPYRLMWDGRGAPLFITLKKGQHKFENAQYPKVR